MRITLLSLGLIITCIADSHAQQAGDALFDTDQVIEIRLTFPDEDYWTTLSLNHFADDETYLPAALEIVDNVGTFFLDSVGVRLKGNSSFDFYPTSKKPMKLDFNRFIGGQNYHGLKKLNLNNCWSDPTFMREKTFFDVSREQDVLAPRMNYANVYLNDIFWGFYALVEQVDRTYLDRWFGENDGFLYKAGDNYTPDGGGLGLEADLNHYGGSPSNYTGRYEAKTHESLNDWSQFIELLDLIDNASSDVLLTELPQRMAWDQVLRSLALDNLFGNMDAYYGSARNYYLYQDSTALQWHWIKWDANMSYGRYVPFNIDDPALLPAAFTTPGRRLLQRVLQNPTLRTAYLNAYCGVFEAFTNELLDPRIDALADLIRPHVEADINKEFDNGIFDLNIEQTVTAQSGLNWNTVPGLKSFIAQRRAFLLSTGLDCTTAGLSELADQPMRAFPNPTSGVITLSLPPGVRSNTIQVFDPMGRLVDEQPWTGRLDLSAQPAGTYTIQLQDQGNTVRALVIKE
ncbi:MAG: CotH kinase family protein [Flavobacteriales bacterium]